MFYVMHNGQLTLDAQGEPIVYSSKQDALGAISYYDIGANDVYSVIHYMDHLKLQLEQAKES